MNPRTRLILLALGGVAVLGLLAVGYFTVVQPFLDRVTEVKQQELAAVKKETELDDLRMETKRLGEYHKRSLPADPDVAKSEYKLALEKVLRDSGAHGYTVNYLDGDSNNRTGIPQVDPAFKPKRDDKPAEYLTYTQVVYKIDVPKTDLATAAEILRRYYSLGLIQQISHLELRHTTADLEKDVRGAKERSDLKMEIVTKAVIVNGAAARRTLLPAPAVYGGVVGGGGLFSLEQSPGAARNVNPVPDELLVALAKGRDYSLLAAKDPFHGTLPPPPEPYGTVSGFVFEDLNDDGVWGEDEKGVSGVSVTLAQVVNGKAGAEKKATTDQNGAYRFTSVKPGGGYTLKVASSSQFTPGKSVVGSTGGSNAVPGELSGVAVPVDGESKNNAFGGLPPIPTKPDYSEYIHYTSSFHTIDGEEHTITIFIRDKINKEDYELVFTQAGEKVRVKVFKWEYQDYKADAAQKKKKVYSQETLEISKYTMRNKNDFTVHGVDTDGSLILSERPAVEAAKEEKPRPGGGFGGGFGGGRPPATKPPLDPKAAVVGGIGVPAAPRPEKFYRWESGKSLKQIVELNKAEADKAIRRAQTRFLADGGGSGSSTTVTTPPKEPAEKEKP